MPRQDSFPRFTGKWQHPSLVDPRKFVRRYFPKLHAPRRCVLLWKPGLPARLARRFHARPFGGFTNTYVMPRHAKALGFSMPRGVGGPATITRSEELSALGTTEFIGIGYAGGLSSDLHPGDIVLCDGAVRDEGTSHHYAPSHVPATPSPTLTRWVRRTLKDAGVAFRVGGTWTTDAPYRETRPELLHYRKQGVLTVDMEAASMFIFGRTRRVRTASVFVVSDVLREKSWEPHFERVGPRLEELTEAILRASIP